MELKASDGCSGHSSEGQAALMQLRQRPKPGGTVLCSSCSPALAALPLAERRKTIRLPGFFSPLRVCQLHLLRGKRCSSGQGMSRHVEGRSHTPSPSQTRSRKSTSGLPVESAMKPINSGSARLSRGTLVSATASQTPPPCSPGASPIPASSTTDLKSSC